ncbi:nucleotidyltransferase [Acinetobacter defluvii]|uniref:nucleotidyltransferase domain-containing protein n=1 Tax=Acinetobacter defluvii TaxID=1871111 RepID=UPI00148FFD6C|nr:nucleotidyltransferase domain-containing protein [Acinetobacter defluvii]NNP73980.1 nucleotidyltransferase [Acinetobacter defluvii]
MTNSIVIESAFSTILNQVIHIFRTKFPIELHSLYVYGSVAQGTAIVGTSDLDLCVVFHYQVDDLEMKISDIQSYIMSVSPMFSKIDIDIGFLDDVLDPKNQKRWGAWIKFFCHFIDGEDLSIHFKDIQIDRSVIQAINQGYDQDIQSYFSALEIHDQTLQERINLKKSLIKRMIRLVPLSWSEIETWPLNLNETLAQAMQNDPEHKVMFQYLLEELENPNDVNTTSLDRLREIYAWIYIHLK